MSSTDTITRREFTLQTALAILSGVAITISGCGESDSPTAPSPSPTPNPSAPTPNPFRDVRGTIAANHGHSAVIVSAALAAGNTLILNIRGAADHPHTVELTAQDLTRIQERQRVRKASSTDQSHNHTVTFN